MVVTIGGSGVQEKVAILTQSSILSVSKNLLTSINYVTDSDQHSFRFKKSEYNKDLERNVN